MKLKLNTLTMTFSLIIAIIFAFVAYTITIAATTGGNDFMDGHLRVDLPQIYNAMDYRVMVNATAWPSNGYPNYTTGWLGVDLAPNLGHFTQIGLITQSSNNIHWFVWAPSAATVTCLRGGHTGWVGIHGCEGANGDLVSLSSWYYVELVTYPGQGNWVARVAGYDVAIIYDNSTTITKAYVTMEEAYTTAQDPYVLASFYFWHPQYMGTTTWQDWTASSGGGDSDSVVIAEDYHLQNTFCPQHYGVTPNYAGSERAWYAGTGGQVCWWLLFPADHIYLPLVMK